VVSFNGVSVYHAGDTSYIPEMASLAALKVDYALLPTDGYWNMGGEEARRCADAVMARHAIAIHSSPKGLYDAALAAKLEGPDVLALALGETLTLQKR
jgi:L-ascorbate metabolism protein UlaG (beta-lactamase superfamily)